MIRFDGPYQLDIVCKVVSPDDVDRFIISLIARFSRFIQRRRIAVNACWARYLPRNYLTGKPRLKLLDRGYGTGPERIDVDPTGRFILKMLSTNSRASATEIAEAIENDRSLKPISSSAVGKRVESMIRSKVISGFSIGLNNELIGQVMFKVLLFMSSMSEQESKRFVNFCLRHPNVVHLMRTIGQWDYELDIETQDVRALHEILMSLTREFPRSVQDYVLLDNVKTFKYRFLEVEGPAA